MVSGRCHLQFIPGLHSCTGESCSLPMQGRLALGHAYLRNSLFTLLGKTGLNKNKTDKKRFSGYPV